MLKRLHNVHFALMTFPDQTALKHWHHCIVWLFCWASSPTEVQLSSLRVTEIPKTRIEKREKKRSPSWSREGIQTKIGWLLLRNNQFRDKLQSFNSFDCLTKNREQQAVMRRGSGSGGVSACVSLCVSVGGVRSGYKLQTINRNINISLCLSKPLIRYK